MAAGDHAVPRSKIPRQITEYALSNDGPNNDKACVIPLSQITELGHKMNNPDVKEFTDYWLINMR